MIPFGRSFAPTFNKARNAKVALRHVARIYPFIELPDLMVKVPAKIDESSWKAD